MYNVVTIIVILLGISIIILSFYKDKNTPLVTQKLKKEDKIDHYEEYGARIEELNNKILELNEYGTFLKSELDKKHKELLFLYQIIHEKTKEINIENNSFNEEANRETLEVGINNKQNEVIEQSKIMTKQKDNEEFQEKSKDKSFNNNKMILQLSGRGYSVTEIAQMLNIGQGEVKLVLDLFK